MTMTSGDEGRLLAPLTVFVVDACNFVAHDAIPDGSPLRRFFSMTFRVARSELTLSDASRERCVERSLVRA